MQEIMEQPKTVVIEGKEYTVRRLALFDIFRFVNILKHANLLAKFGELMKTFDTENEKNDESARELRVGAGIELILSLADAEEQIYEFIAGIIQADKNIVKHFPPEAIVDILEIVFRSNDLKAFLDRVARLTKQTK
jgi:actin-like ATPase involved in cell morphogenesis